MSLPALRPEFDIGMYSALQLAPPPATSSPPSYKPPRDGPLELWMSPPQPARELYDHILHAQGLLRISLKHTGWPQRFYNRPLDIITASVRLPVWGPNTYKEDLMLGRWRGELLRSTAASEARMRGLIYAGMFRHRPLRITPAATARGYKSKWKKFICYIFRAFEISPSLRRDIYNVPLRSDNVQMMRHILNLASEMVS
ncbi:hypothetical protein EDB80DRAFT_757971 [Ilyonectria destructans]|nr:hypothetical protein EDB80DRAFT_757971 [Ilyonectria destructans]